MPTPYALSSDLVSAWPAKSLEVATYLDTALAAKTDTAMTQNAQTGTTYSFALADASKLLTTSNASPVSVTVTKQATVAWVTGTQLRVLNLGAGVTTLVADTGVTINNNKALGQYQGGTLIRTASDVWTFQPNGAGGKILQVVSTTKSDTFSTTSTTFTDVTGLTATITPTSATSTVLVFVNSNYSNSAGAEIGLFRLLRGATVIAAGDVAGSRSPVFATTRIADVSATIAVAVNHRDSPATASATVYKVQMAVQSNTGYVNRTAADADAANQGRSVSSITLMEVSA